MEITSLSMCVQVLSMSCFMFASGVLMTRMPLLPIIMLSFCYLYGGMESMTAIPSFTLTHPWLWFFTHLTIALLLAFAWSGFRRIATKSSGPDSMGIGFLGVWLIAITVGVVAIGILLSIFPALFKWIKLLSVVSCSPWQTILYCLLFVGGFGIGIYVLCDRLAIAHFFEGAVREILFCRILRVAFVALIICWSSLFSFYFCRNVAIKTLVSLATMYASIKLCRWCYFRMLLSCYM